MLGFWRDLKKLSIAPEITTSISSGSRRLPARDPAGAVSKELVTGRALQALISS